MSVLTFESVGKRSARALQAYQILIGAASNRQIYTYALLAEKMGMPNGQRMLSQTLGHLMFWCKQNDLPSLTSLVVQKTTGLPGVGLTEPDDVNRERELVYDYQWYSIVPPTADELGDAYAAAHAE